MGASARSNGPLCLGEYGHFWAKFLFYLSGRFAGRKRLYTATGPWCLEEFGKIFLRAVGTRSMGLWCVMHFNFIKSDGILDLYLDFYFTWKIKYIVMENDRDIMTGGNAG
jgi:hypothetical protein